MNRSNICITIPIYKEVLNDLEKIAVQQCFSVLRNYAIYFSCSKELNISFYKENYPECNGYVYFDATYFEDIKGYNRLLLSTSFYEQFKQFEYLLIYQTDCYVFRDELLDWAQKGYDYIGGLWFDDFTKNPEEGAQPWFPGNGGFSLRNIPKMLQLLSSKKPLKKWDEIFVEKRITSNTNVLRDWKRIVVAILNIFGYHNNSSFYAQQWNKNEDGYFFEMYSKYNKLIIPKVTESALFSWDRRPDYLFEKLGKLPFGCHAWFREDYPYQQNKNFWFKKIE